MVLMVTGSDPMATYRFTDCVHWHKMKIYYRKFLLLQGAKNFITLCISYFITGMLKISLAGANNSVPTTGLMPCSTCIYIHVIIVAPKEKKHRRPLAFPGAVNGVIASILHP